MRNLLACSVCALALAATSSADAAYILNGTPQAANITKTGGNFANAVILGWTQSQAAEVKNYKELKVDVTFTTRAADTNLGMALNAPEVSYRGVGAESWFWYAGQTATFTYNYSNDTTFKNAATLWASGGGSWRQLLLQSTYPNYSGTNTFMVNKIYLDSPVPEPASLGTVAFGGSLMLLRRRRRGDHDAS